MNKKIIKDGGSVFGGIHSWEILNDTVRDLNPSKIFILVDTNTSEQCLPYFNKNFKASIEIIVITIPAGESFKTIDTCVMLWEKLSASKADRKSLIINLGGGVITDLGGFVASTYQRGIPFINIPTSLLAMVDAAVGGKNGVDLGVLKNQIGIIKNAVIVIVDTYFLNTLPKTQFYSGMTEMVKHGCIHSDEYLNEVMRLDISDHPNIDKLVWESIVIKNDIITKDPFEKNLRKTLNYGHTLGHAIESYHLEHPNKKALLHGEAVAIGILLANLISKELFNFPKNKLDTIARFITKHYPKVAFSDSDIDEIIKLLLFDKKNSHGKVLFVLLEDIGTPQLNCEVSNELINSAFKYYASC